MTSVCPRAVKICTDLVDLFEGVGEDREEELAVRPLNVARNRSFSDLEKVSGHLKMSWTIREGEASAPSPSAFGGVQASAVFSSRSSFSAGSTIGEWRRENEIKTNKQTNNTKLFATKHIREQDSK